MTRRAPGGAAGGATWRNWAGNVVSRPAAVLRPRAVEEVQAAVRGAASRGLRIKAVGAGHSFSGLAATDGVLLSLDELSGLVHADAATGRVRFRAGTRLHRIPALLEPYGLAMANLGDIDRQSLAGATSTGTHGTGLRFGGLATQVTSATLVLADGALLEVGPDENAELLPLVALGLGALGILVELEIQCVPAFLLHAVEGPEPLGGVLESFRERTEQEDHVEFYWWPHTDTAMVRTNTRLPGDAVRRPEGRLAAFAEEQLLANGALALKSALGRALPATIPAVNRLATRVYGSRDLVDRSHEVFTSPRRVRFRELEMAVPRAAVPEAVAELRALVERRGWRLSFPVEVRVAAADRLWLSTASGRESGYIAVHRYWGEHFEEVLREAGAVLRAFDGRPHWGKLHWEDAASLRARYPRFDEAVAVRDRLDPERRFANSELERVLGP
ncbi:D-arabinono-1,4-lactone oxidase [Homoserinibacter sp. YIM 151385]|uniref:D-arabinono-1,4-lactone oxidase n=1 Tax=Homoserinibacter sp. YIM 151385 TaxID=2985506 RepID=UPI0022F0A4BB|nr:D-arabinono-1,4-lactone oxidase [Homoserinibacter sp. YIM 151385]WBU38055.1 FAD-binding protein [Homoserinibacter sp. YIM 151385]